MKNRSYLILLFSLCLLSCTAGRQGDGDIRTAVNTPNQFDVPAGMAWGDNTCKNPIIDPQDGTELILVQSRDGMGDYRVTGMKYGVNQGELLRVNCRTGAVVGIVRGR